MLDIFLRLSAHGTSPYHPTVDQRAAEFLQPQLSERVPLEVHRLFEIARGALLYGVFFYPLYALGSEQLLRVVEAAVAHKCVELVAPRNVQRGAFRMQLAYLSQEGLIPDAAWVRWDATRNLRNLASHPKKPTLYGPGEALESLWITTEQINALYPAPWPKDSTTSQALSPMSNYLPLAGSKRSCCPRQNASLTITAPYQEASFRPQNAW
jgi:hypothetical protein